MVPPDSYLFMRSSDWGHQKLPLISAESSYSTHKSQSSQYRFGLLSTSTRTPIPQEQVASWSARRDLNPQCIFVQHFKCCAFRQFRHSPMDTVVQAIPTNAIGDNYMKNNLFLNLCINIISKFLIKIKFRYQTKFRSEQYIQAREFQDNNLYDQHEYLVRPKLYNLQ